MIEMIDFHGHVGRKILMDFKAFTEEIPLVKEITKEECYWNLVTQSTYTSPAHGLEWLTRNS